MVGNPFTKQALPHLVQFIDPVFMQARFEAHLPQTVEKCRIEKISFRPEKHCSALFRLYLCDTNQTRSEQWFFAKMYRHGQGEKRYVKEKAKFASTSKVTEAVSFWPDWETILWAFPHDGNLPQLADLIQESRIQQLVHQHHTLLGFSPDAVCEYAECKRVKYVPGKRCVLRFKVGVREPEQPIRELEFYSKTFSNAQSRYVYDTLQTVRASLGTSDQQFEIPPLLGHVSNLHTFWQASWSGTSMSNLYGLKEWPLAPVAQGLAMFHLSDISGLRPAHYLDEIVSEVVGDAEWIADFVPSLGERTLELAERIAMLEPVILASKQKTAVPIHGAFRMSQLLYQPDAGENGRIAMIDLDAIALGDPHYDVAEFMASTLYQQFHRDHPLSNLERLAAEFKQRYAAQVPWPINDQLLAWYMAASLLGKLRGSFKRIQFPAIAKSDALLSLVNHQLEGVVQ